MLLIKHQCSTYSIYIKFPNKLQHNENKYLNKSPKLLCRRSGGGVEEELRSGGGVEEEWRRSGGGGGGRG